MREGQPIWAFLMDDAGADEDWERMSFEPKYPSDEAYNDLCLVDEMLTSPLELVE